jgi:hypothetical protein
MEGKPVITNTRIANTDLKITGGSYFIPEEEYWRVSSEIYHNDVFH